MSQTLTLNTRQPLAIVGKSGKVGKSAEKAHAMVLSASEAGRLALALDGRGIIGKTARTAFVAPTLAQLLALDKLDGSQWGDLFPMLAQEINVIPSALVLNQRGRAKVNAYLQHARAELTARFERADTVKAQNRAFDRLTEFDAIAANVQRLNEAHESAAREARALEQAGLTQSEVGAVQDTSLSEPAFDAVGAVEDRAMG